MSGEHHNAGRSTSGKHGMDRIIYIFGKSIIIQGRVCPEHIVLHGMILQDEVCPGMILQDEACPGTILQDEACLGMILQDRASPGTVLQDKIYLET